MSRLHTNRKNTTATKMREALTPTGGKVLTGAADTGRLSTKGIQIETTANRQNFRQKMPADC